MKICDRIKGLRIGKSITQKELGEMIGVSTVTIQCWESGSKKPSMDAIIALSKTLNVSSDYLLGVESDHKVDSVLFMNESEKSLIDDYRRLDYYGRESVRAVCRVEKDRIINGQQDVGRIRYIPRYITPSAAGISAPLEGDDFEMVPIDSGIPPRTDFAVRIQGDSMLPYIHDGDTVFVQKTSEMRNGDIGIFCVNGAMYCKQFYLDSIGNLYLVSSNQAYEDTNIYIQADGYYDFKAYGKVILGYNTEMPEYFTENLKQLT